MNKLSYFSIRDNSRFQKWCVTVSLSESLQKTFGKLHAESVWVWHNRARAKTKSFTVDVSILVIFVPPWAFDYIYSADISIHSSINAFSLPSNSVCFSSLWIFSCSRLCNSFLLESITRMLFSISNCRKRVSTSATCGH